MRELESITIEGFRSIKSQALPLRRLNLVIGGNGVGKSNLVSAFRFLHDIYHERLQTLSDSSNPANYFFRGPKVTPQIHFKLRFVEDKIATEYEVRLGYGESRLYIVSEKASNHDSEKYSLPRTTLGVSTTIVTYQGKESSLRKTGMKTHKDVSEDISAYRVYHFHDTGQTARVKQSVRVDNNRSLDTDAANLAAILYVLRETHPDHYNLIESTIRQIAPFFDGFVLQPLRANKEMIKLEWRERGSDDYFDAHSLSDGTLRFMCLATLLLQPEAPRLILLDEPELGLHPAAIQLLAGLLRQASHRSQILLATQSVTLINQFEPEDIIVADRQDGGTTFTRLESEPFAAWMEEYSLGEMWEKNLIGGRP